MSEMKRDLDLAALARAPAAAQLPPKRRRWLTRLLPIALVVGFGAVLFSTLGDLWRGAVPVTIVRPRAADGATSGAGGGGGELQRSGWVEPDPFPTLVTPLAAGVVHELLVLESDVVRKEQPIARLVDDEAKLALAQADAALARARAEARKAQIERELAQASFDAALEVTEAAASAVADVAGRTAEADHRAAAAREAESKVRIAEEELALQDYLAQNGSAGPRQLELARARLDAERAGLDVLKADAALATAEVEKARARLVRATRERELRLADRSRNETAQAGLAAAEAAVAEATAARDGAALRLARMTVVAPADGVVLQRLVGPGAAVGGPGDPPLASLYDPASLRVRIDVEQSEVARLAVGQRAQVKSPMRPDRRFEGEVIRLVQFADIQKVTLQVHVRVRDPDGALRPEMLVEVRFLARDAAAAGDGSGSKDGGGGSGEGTEGAGGAVSLPARLLFERDGASCVWIVDPLSGRAAVRRVELLRKEGEQALVRSGLNVSDKVIDEGRESLRDGARVEVH